MKPQSIIQAITDILRMEGKPLSVTEVYDGIVQNNLYTFKSDRPLHIVQTQLRRHTKSLDFPSASQTKYFRILSDGKYTLLSKSIREQSPRVPDTSTANLRPSPDSLRHLHSQYLKQTRRKILVELKRLDPQAFEGFCKQLLIKYGFKEVEVTQISRDGGIDGHGKLKVGFAYFNVAFQCKRWTKSNVGRREVNQFRGDIQGRFEQGIFFTTADFTREAKECSFQPGAVTIVLINGNTIVDFMLEKEFGVEIETLPLYHLAIDLAIASDQELSTDLLLPNGRIKS